MKIIESSENRDIVMVACTEPAFGSYIGVLRLSVHPGRDCAGRPCAIHNPSDHVLSGQPQLWRADRHMMERICVHAIGHPDPDGLQTDAGHSCDGCCVEENRDG